MDISLLHAGLAAGAALAAVPVIIHLVMRQTPKHVVFPALRLIRPRHRRSTKRLRIRNWLLLLARMALVALMALALARPALNAPGALGDREVPSAVGLVFDTSLSMGYVVAGKTRLEEAKDRARDILARLPEASLVFVVDSAEPGVPFPASPAAARRRIAALELRAANRPLNAALGQAYAAVAAADRPRHEVYVLTDLTRAAWDLARPVEGLEKARGVRLGLATYVLRLAPPEARDAAIVAAEAHPAVPGGADADGNPFEIRGRIRSAGPASSRLVEFLLDGTRRGQAAVDLPADGEAEVRFTTPPNLAEGLHRAELRLVGADPLAFDDRRFLSFAVDPALRVLVVYDPVAGAERPTIDASFLANALDPYGFGRPYRVESLASTRLEAGFPNALKDYACVFANDVRRLGDACWGQLNAYVREGGGLVVGLGHRIDRDSYNGPSAQSLLPASIGAAVAPPGGTSFGQADFSHPIFGRVPRDLAADLSGVPVWRYWAVTPAQRARPLLAFQDGAAALLERDIPGTEVGRVLLWTTPLSYRPEPNDPAAWNAFPLFWSFVAVAEQTVPYVAGSAGRRLNFEAGEDVFLPIEPGRTALTYAVVAPDGKPTGRLSPTAREATLIIEAPPTPGHWSVTASDPGRRAGSLGFSINPRADEARLTPLEPRDLDALFGTDGYKLADDPRSLQAAIATTRIGHEIFPWIMAMILALLTAENLLANRFHREQSGARSP
ncbi:MAG TPA: BatA domain-containing protein [Isosphaeraceae bacterium]|jgi:hypothetical protein